jgi:hypothetical protein
MIVLGIYGEYESRSSGLNLSIMLLAQGQLDIAGIASAYLSILLEMTYQGQTGTLIGTGSVSVSIKISFFFTLRVSTQVRYVFAGNANNEAEQSKSDQAVNDYLAMMEG